MEAILPLFEEASTGALIAIMGVGGVGLAISLVPWAAKRAKALFGALGRS